MHDLHGARARQQRAQRRVVSLPAEAALVFRWLPTAAYMVANWMVSDTPGERLGPLPAPDWLLHALAYFLFGPTLYLAMGGERFRAFAAAGVFAAYAALDEWHQSWVPGRSAALPDWLADVVGAGLGWLAAWRLDAAYLQHRRPVESQRSDRSRRSTESLRRPGTSAWLLVWLSLAAVGLAVALGPVVPVADRSHSTPDAPSLVQIHTLLDEVEHALVSGDVAGARERLGRAAVGDGERSYAAFRYLTLQARVALATRKPESAVGSARAALELAVEDDRLDARLLPAEALEAAGQYEAAFDLLLDVAWDPGVIYRGLLRHRVLDWLAALAERLDPDTPSTRARLLRYGRTLYRFGRWQEGVALFSRPGWQEQQIQAFSELARGLGALGQRARQLALLEQALDEARRQALPASHLSPLRVQLAAALQSAGQAQRAETLLEAVLREDAGSPAAGEALSSLVRAALDSGDVARALGWVERHGAAALATTGWKEALWSLFAAACGTTACEAVAPRSDGTGRREPSAARRALDLLAAGDARDAAYLYWQARLDPEGRPALVAQLWRTHPLSYYAVLASQRWPELVPEAPSAGKTGPDARSESPGGLARPTAPASTRLTTSALSAASDLSAIAALREAGRRREAMLELRYLLAAADFGAQPSRERLATLARWELELDEFRASIRHLNRFLQASADAASAVPPGQPVGQLAEGQWILRALFPRPHDEIVQAEATAHQLDPMLIWAVMREESSFEPQALSPFDAYGLMQLIPSTARWMGDRLRVRWSSPADLFDPALNIRLGAAYLRYLLDRYGDVRMAVAAYHAGPGRVDRWAAQFPRADEELWVERIPIVATRRYVQTVYRSYYIYRALYGAGPASP